MAEVIAYSTNVGPRLARAESFRPISEAVGRFAYSQESILDRKDYLLVTAEDVEVHARGKTLDPYNIV